MQTDTNSKPVSQFRAECIRERIAGQKRLEARKQLERDATREYGAKVAYANPVRAEISLWFAGNRTGGRYFPSLDETLIVVPASDYQARLAAQIKA